ncbi:alpha/beta hydrolase [Kytococcus sp. Marseille-QA3725]
MRTAPAPLPSTRTVLEGAEGRHLDGSPDRAGVLLLHGFTGTPQGLGSWPDALAAAGHTVDAPRLTGHGRTWQAANRTGWQDWYRAAERSLLRASHERPAVVGGLSMGGALALALAIAHPARVAGLALVNPAVAAVNPLVRLTPLVRQVVPDVAGIAGDVADPEAPAELAYDRVPLHALHSQRALWRGVRRRAAEVTCPVLLLRSAVDHVVPARSSAAILRRVSATDVTEVVLPDSFHVATLDHDAERIHAESVAFARRVTA